jgi:DUF1365 family protein
MLGYVFNPLSVWFCRDGNLLRAVVYEVHNTFGERHAYVLPAGQPRGLCSTDAAQSCVKTFYVSPFLDMAGDYTFRLRADGARLSVAIRMRTRDGEVLTAVLSGTCAPLTDKALVGALLRYPLMTLAVTVAVYWQALRLVCKGAKFYHRSQGRRPGSVDASRRRP